MGVTVVVWMLDGMNKLPALLLKKVEQKSPGAFSNCTVAPHSVQGLCGGWMVSD